MKIGLVQLVAVTAVALLGNVSTAMADSAAANCEVRKDGDTWKGASGPCTFSQRQGNINLALSNGDSYSLTPSDKQGQYRDQKGIKVVRTLSGDTQEFKWDGGKKIIVTYTGASGAAASTGTSGPDSFDTVCGVMVDGKDYGYRCGATDYYSGGKKVRTELRYPDQTIQLNWHSGNRVGLQFEGMVPQEARYSTSEGETNWVFEGKTYYYFSDKGRARMEFNNFRD
jgi:hypothetical protein